MEEFVNWDGPNDESNSQSQLTPQETSEDAPIPPPKSRKRKLDTFGGYDIDLINDLFKGNGEAKTIMDHVQLNEIGKLFDEFRPNI